MKGFIEVSANHIWGIVCVVGTVCGIPFFYNLISRFDLNTDMARTLVMVVGVLISGVSFALGWNQRNMSVRREISEIESDHAEALKGKQAALDNERRKNAELASILDERKRQEREKAQRNSLREWAFSLDASSKLLLLEAAQTEGEVAHVPAGHDVMKARRELSFEGNAAVYVSHIGNDEDGRGAYRVQISDFGRHVVAECGDILEEAKQYEESQKKAQNPC